MVKILPNTDGSYTKAPRGEAFIRQWEGENTLLELPKDREMVCFRNKHSSTTMKFSTATVIHNSRSLIIDILLEIDTPWRYKNCYMGQLEFEALLKGHRAIPQRVVDARRRQGGAETKVFRCAEQKHCF